MFSVTFVLKLVPVMSTDDPIVAEAGVKPVMVGGTVTVKESDDVATELFTDTMTSPVVASSGTIATIEVVVGVPVIVAAVPLNRTVSSAAVVPKFIPVIVTSVPMGP